MRGIILAGGSGTRLDPLTRAVSKQLLPVYDKPMIYYPLSVLMLAGIRDILIITRPDDAALFERLLGDGAPLGLRLRYATQAHPAGIAEAFRIGEAFLAGEPAALILGDNILFGQGLAKRLQRAARLTEGALIFGYRVQDPERYGVVEIDDDGSVLSIEEKPAVPRSRQAIIGLYFFDGQASAFARELVPSARGELEIVDLQRRYLERGSLRAEQLGRGMAWLDMGTPESLMQASSFVQAVEARQGLKIGCLEEVAYRMRFIDAEAVRRLAEALPESAYRRYLLDTL